MALARYYLLLACAATAARAADPLPWKFDRLVATNGSVFRGLILDETPTAIRFQAVRQHPGRPTVTFCTTFARAEVQDLIRLDNADRAELKARLRGLDPRAEKQRTEKVELEPIAWNGMPDAAWRYQSDLFALESDAPESVVRRAAVRLEEVFAAYARYLPPRIGVVPPKSTTVVLLKSRGEYAARLRAEGRALVNVAYFDPDKQCVVCASDLESLGNDLNRARRETAQLRTEYDARETALSKLYKGKELTRHVAPIRIAREALELADRKNEGVFDRATRQLFATLFHEAFHAYLAGCVYPSPLPGPPRWLNEGLAQIFESAFVEAGELRVGHADRDRLARAQRACRRSELVPLARLLQSGAGDFLAAHASDKASTDASYLTAWIVAFHLTFEQRLLGGAALDGYLRNLASGADPVEAFTTLVGRPIGDYERDLCRFLARLQPDGTTAAPQPEKDK